MRDFSCRRLVRCRIAAAHRLLFALVVAAGALLAAQGPLRAAGVATIQIHSATGVHVFTVELATNDEERERGLMYRKSLPDGQGMLFDFQHDQPATFWMHNTYIPLDMIFIKADGHVLHIAENAKPMSDDLIPSGGPVRGVLEVIGGTAAKLGIKPGDTVTGAFFGPGH